MASHRQLKAINARMKRAAANRRSSYLMGVDYFIYRTKYVLIHQ